MCSDDREFLQKISMSLQTQKLMVATAESCTGGLLANMLTNVSGSSDYFDRGIISYSNRSKIELLNVSENLLKKHGAVSKEVAVAMAEGARIKSNVDIGISTTGIAGPTGGTKEKPVGLVFIAISTKDGNYIKKFQFKGNRLENKRIACKEALEMLLKVLEK